MLALETQFGVFAVSSEYPELMLPIPAGHLPEQLGGTGMPGTVVAVACEEAVRARLLDEPHV